MEYAKLENLYDSFVVASGYEKLCTLASKGGGNENIGIVMMFLSTRFKIKNKSILFNNSFKITVDDKLVTLDLTKAPDFKDQDKFLAWLHQQIFNQT